MASTKRPWAASSSAAARAAASPLPEATALPSAAFSHCGRRATLDAGSTLYRQ
jgi:hypothetical protein